MICISRPQGSSVVWIARSSPALLISLSGDPAGLNQFNRLTLAYTQSYTPSDHCPAMIARFASVCSVLPVFLSSGSLCCTAYRIYRGTAPAPSLPAFLPTTQDHPSTSSSLYPWCHLSSSNVLCNSHYIHSRALLIQSSSFFNDIPSIRPSCQPADCMLPVDH